MSAVRVLYVDDSRLDRELVRDALSQGPGSFTIQEASGQDDFERLLAGGGFDLILSDFNIAGFEGLQVIDAAKIAQPNLPVVIVTGTGSEEVAVEAMKRGAADYVIKTPSHIQRLPFTLQKILERKRLEGERHQLEKLLAERQRMESLGVLAAGVAHDFNNLLTGVIGHLGLLRNELTPNTKQHDRVGKIEAIAERAADLCRQLLAYSGRGRLWVGPIDLNVLVRDTAGLFDHTLGPATRVEFALADGLPSIDADATQLRQVVMNLVINAAEAVGTGPSVIRVSTTCRGATAADSVGPCPLPQPPATRYVVLEVADDGPGIPPEVVARVFDPFFTTKFTGRGLGLAAVLGIVRSHQGSIRVDSRPGFGTIFTVLLPVAATATPAPTITAGPLPTTVGRAVLVVDDEENVRTVVADALVQAGYAVTVAADGIAALAVLAAGAEQFGLLLLDLTMPGMDGEAVLGEVRGKWPGLPVLLMSGFHGGMIEAKFAGPSLAGVLQKPFGPTELLTAVRKAMPDEK